MLIQLCDLRWIICWVSQISLFLQIKDLNEEIDPARNFTWLNQVWLDLDMVTHVENLAQTNHDFRLIWTLIGHHILQKGLNGWIELIANSG